MVAPTVLGKSPYETQPFRRRFLFKSVISEKNNINKILTHYGGYMCTAINETRGRHLFGRTLDLEYSYDEKVVITPRKYEREFIHEGNRRSRFAIIGCAALFGNTALYYDAANEAGLCAAALNFPNLCEYHTKKSGKYNVASFELIPFILGECENVSEAVSLLEKTNITPDSFSDKLPSTPLHWIFADKSRAVTLESTPDGITIHENPVGVMTNAPDFKYHVTRLADYMKLSPRPAQNSLCPYCDVESYSRGLGAVGLPGDYSSSSRFVKAVYVKEHTEKSDTKHGAIERFFHIMDSVSVPSGCILTDEGKNVRTVYTSCIDTAAKVYYFTTYEDRRIRAVSLTECATSGLDHTVFDMGSEPDIRRLN